MTSPADRKDEEILALLARQAPASALKTLLALKNISQSELALKLGIPCSEISRVISGKSKNARVRLALAQALAVPVQILFGPLDAKSETTLE